MNGSSAYGIDYALPGGGAAVYNASGFQFFRQAGALGSAALTTNLSRALLSSEYYAPFGFDESGAGAGYRSFTGQKQLTDSLHSGGQYDFLHREYNPDQGCWWTPDPAGLAAVDPNNPQTWNEYAYVAGTPLEATDPTGLIGEDIPGPGDPGGICGVDPLDPRCPLGGGGAYLGVLIPPNSGGGWGGWGGVAPLPGGAGAPANPPGSAAPGGASPASVTKEDLAGTGEVVAGGVCEFVEPCGALEDFVIGVVAVSEGAAELYILLRGGQQDVKDTGISAQAQALVKAGKFPDICAALNFLYATTTDPVVSQRTKQTQKGYGRRRSSKGK